MTAVHSWMQPQLLLQPLLGSWLLQQQQLNQRQLWVLLKSLVGWAVLWAARCRAATCGMVCWQHQVSPFCHSSARSWWELSFVMHLRTPACQVAGNAYTAATF